MPAQGNKPLSLLIKERSRELGFDLCGIAASRSLEEREDILKDWCNSGMNAGMSYLARETGKRINPGSLVPGAKSLIVTGINYYSDILQKEQGVPVISRYAYGESYQELIKSKLSELLKFIKSVEPCAEGRPFSDTAPLLEKGWAVEAGLGWQGKHSIVINKDIGSFFFIGILIINLELEYDEPYKNEYCGTCRLCIELCPTGAINENRTIDARKCIANLNIEERNAIPDEILPEVERRIYGCDRCQEICPWNLRARPNNVPEFAVSDELIRMSLDDWINLSRESFKRIFRKSPVERKKYEIFMENVRKITQAE